MKFKSIKIKIAFWTGICLIFTAAFIITYSAVSIKKQLKTAGDTAVNNAKKITEAFAKEQAAHIKSELETALDTARTLAAVFSGIKDKGSGPELKREALNRILRTILVGNPQFAGIRTVWEPNAFDGMDTEYANREGHDENGRFIPYWNRGEEKGEIVLETLTDYESENALWYQIPKKTGQEYISSPFRYPLQGGSVLMISLLVPIVSDDIFYGVVGVDIRPDLLQKPADDVQDGSEGSIRMEVISNQGIFAAVSGHPEQAGKHMGEVYKNPEDDLESVRNGKGFSREEGGRLTVFAPVHIGRTAAPWSVRMNIPMTQATAEADARMLLARKDMMRMIGISIMCILPALFFIFVIAERSTRSLGTEPGELAAVAQQIALGDMNIQFPDSGTRGVYRNLREMTESLLEKARFAERIASGDLRSKAEIRSEKDMLGKALEQMVYNLREVISNVRRTAGRVEESSGYISDSSRVLAEGANEQAASLEEISSSMTQLASQTKSNAENASRSGSLAHEARQAAEQGKREMKNMISAMREISAASRSVAKIIKVIDEIAFQTNLLSLNAAIEAARAGRYGKGFAVVAGEVRNLAGKSAQAAKETEELIESALEKVEKGNDIASQTARALDRILESAVQTADLINEIAAASEEQTRGIEQISQGLHQVDQVTQNNAANAQETASSVMQMAVQAEELRRMISRFQLEDNIRESPYDKIPKNQGAEKTEEKNGQEYFSHAENSAAGKKGSVLHPETSSGCPDEPDKMTFFDKEFS